MDATKYDTPLSCVFHPDSLLSTNPLTSRTPWVEASTRPRPWLVSCPRWASGTGSCPPTRWPAWPAAAEWVRAAWPPGASEGWRSTAEPPRIPASPVANTTGVRIDWWRRNRNVKGIQGVGKGFCLVGLFFCGNDWQVCLNVISAVCSHQFLFIAGARRHTSPLVL